MFSAFVRGLCPGDVLVDRLEMDAARVTDLELRVNTCMKLTTSRLPKDRNDTRDVDRDENRVREVILCIGLHVSTSWVGLDRRTHLHLNRGWTFLHLSHLARGWTFLHLRTLLHNRGGGRTLHHHLRLHRLDHRTRRAKGKENGQGWPDGRTDGAVKLEPNAQTGNGHSTIEAFYQQQTMDKL